MGLAGDPIVRDTGLVATFSWTGGVLAACFPPSCCPPLHCIGSSNIDHPRAPLRKYGGPLSLTTGWTNHHYWVDHQTVRQNIRKSDFQTQWSGFRGLTHAN